MADRHFVFKIRVKVVHCIRRVISSHYHHYAVLDVYIPHN